MTQYLHAVTPQRYNDLAPQIHQWCQDRTDEGNTADYLVCPDASAYDLRARLAAEMFDSLMMAGPLPQIQVMLSPDGHTARWLSALGLLTRRDSRVDTMRTPGTDQCGLPFVSDGGGADVGWLNLDNMYQLTADQCTDQYRRWYARRHAMHVDQFASCPPVIISLDHFDYVDPNGVDYGMFGRITAAEFASVSKCFTRLESPLDASGSDDQMAIEQAALMYGVMTGGLDLGDGQELIYWGKYIDLIRRPMQAPIVFLWGSHICETYVRSGFYFGALIDLDSAAKPCQVVQVCYNQSGGFKFSTVLAGGRFGEAAAATQAAEMMPLQYVVDPSIRLSQGILAQLQAVQAAGGPQPLTSADIAQIQAWFAQRDARMDGQDTTIAGIGDRVTKLEGGAVVSNPLPPPPPPTVARLNIGAATISDPAGDWVGTNGSIGSALAQRMAVDTSACPGVPAAVLQTGAYSAGPNTFKFTGLTPGKAMTLRLYFAETFVAARTQRITCGQAVLDNFNIAASAGGMSKGVFHDLPNVVVAADGTLSFAVQVLSGDGNSWISGAALI